MNKVTFKNPTEAESYLKARTKRITCPKCKRENCVTISVYEFGYTGEKKRRFKIDCDSPRCDYYYPLVFAKLSDAKKVLCQIDKNTYKMNKELKRA